MKQFFIITLILCLLQAGAMSFNQSFSHADTKVHQEGRQQSGVLIAAEDTSTRKTEKPGSMRTISNPINTKQQSTVKSPGSAASSTKATPLRRLNQKGNLTSGQQRQMIMQKLKDMGFQVSQVTPSGKDNWIVKVRQFDEKKASPAMRGGITRMVSQVNQGALAGKANAMQTGQVMTRGSAMSPGGGGYGDIEEAPGGVLPGGGPGGPGGGEQGPGGVEPGSGPGGNPGGGPGGNPGGGEEAPGGITPGVEPDGPGGGEQGPGGGEEGPDGGQPGGNPDGGGPEPGGDNGPPEPDDGDSGGGGEEGPPGNPDGDDDMISSKLSSRSTVGLSQSSVQVGGVSATSARGNAAGGFATLKVGFTNSGEMAIGADSLSQAGFKADSGKLKMNGIILK